MFYLFLDEFQYVVLRKSRALASVKKNKSECDRRWPIISSIDFKLITMRLPFAFFTFIVTISVCVAYNPFDYREYSTVALPFRYNGIVPDFIDTAPKELLEMKFKKFFAYLGNEASASEVADQPKFSWRCDPDEYYTIYVTDIDPLGRDSPLLREVQLLVIGNIKHCDVSKGEVLTDWFPPSPVKGSGPHRIVAFLWEQKRKIKFEEEFVSYP